ncbi:iron ABC transporter permease [Leifsonia sp. Leaf336]|uniref:iron chelate uptake ABC transporter family permease subunit n=1 Tax=Leifsonia sp. Leaf336 TaxID=1736341 RepID=UPI000701EA8A|nr:iron chelate uptake ABC transporter family permease subunit [Leifsonia sp. Leaf336]KQR50870.1 iron ABC transporter permease [Leifsonia sp. Leaf336]
MSTATTPAARRHHATRALPQAIAVALLIATPLVILLAICSGPAGISPAVALEVIGRHLGLTAGRPDALADGIVWGLRMPRIVAAGAVGAGLSLCGVVMQGVTGNALAEPYLLGLSSGASLGAVCVVLLGLAVALPFAAFGGAGLALVATLGLASARGGLAPATTVLAGIAVSSFCGALTSVVIFWSSTGDSYRDIIGWLLGSLSGVTWPSALVAVGALVVAGAPLAASGRLLDCFAFGDVAAASLGVPVRTTRVLLLVGCSLLTGVLVSISGSIGFVGLVVPHLLRLVIGPRHQPLLLLGALAGALFLIVADTVARSAFAPRELPVGIVTALLGAPTLAALLAGRRVRA